MLNLCLSKDYFKRLIKASIVPFTAIMFGIFIGASIVFDGNQVDPSTPDQIVNFYNTHQRAILDEHLTEIEQVYLLECLDSNRYNDFWQLDRILLCKDETIKLREVIQ